ncbi:MAG: carboxypeptidase M32 [Candidatus Heimdallarchaeota archaeon]|nr:carboxypeptidase M32 [Candidatus Heimdallarchaeota archaeon]
MSEEYSRLMTLYKEQVILDQISGLARWDYETKMPQKGVQQRGEMFGLISKLDHELKTNKEIDSLLDTLEQSKVFKTLNADERRNILLIRREYDQQTKIPGELLVEQSKLMATAGQAWRKAKQENNWKEFEPFIEQHVNLAKQIAKHLNENMDPYDVMLDIFEPGMNQNRYDTLFNELRDGTVELLKKINEAEPGDRKLIKRRVTIKRQEKLMEELMKVIGFDLQAGRLDVAAHPFTSGPGMDDVRITTRYIINDFSSSFFSVAHEGGHGIYEQNSDPDVKFQPVSRYCSMGIHESQSRMYENIFCRSDKFWKYFMPVLNKITRDGFKDVKFNDFMKAINVVRPSMIRVEADEVTYNMHIILRYELERDLINGRIEVNDLPQLWNNKMEQYLGIVPETDSEGVLQDIHWSSGAFGYFPTYTLGNIYAAQFLKLGLEKAIPGWEKDLTKGNFKRINQWLHKNIHNVGNRFDPYDLVEKVTGEPPSAKYLLEYLNEKYASIYNLK